MKSSETIKELSAALVKAQGEIKNLYPSSKGYGYDYVPLNEIIDMLKGILPKYGLAYIQLPFGGQSGNTVGLTTRIIHDSGEWLEETAEFPVTDMKGVNATQKAGAAITYFRRYALLSAFGITGDKDVDSSDQAFTSPKSQKTEQAAAKASRQPKYQETEKSKELVNTVMDYINAGVITGDSLKYARQYIFDNDVTGLEDIANWARKISA